MEDPSRRLSLPRGAPSRLLSATRDSDLPAVWLGRRKLRGASPLPFSRCRECGFVFREDADQRALYETGSYGDDGGERYVAEDEARRRDARVRLRWLGPVAGAGQLLDVGAAGGAFVAEAADVGHNARGIEPRQGLRATPAMYSGQMYGPGLSRARTSHRAPLMW